jgi:Chaperone of endosialidase
MRRTVSVAGVVVFAGAAVLATVAAPAAEAQAPAAPRTSVPRVVRIDGAVPPGAPSTSGTVSIGASIYDADTGGTLLWDETQVVTLDAQGRYTLYLGGSQADGLPAAVLTASAPLWLSLQVAGGAPEARVPLTSVPFALRAADADTLGGLPPSAYLRVDPAGDTTSATTAATTGTAAARSRTTDPLVSTGTANYIGKFTNAVDLTNSVMFENNGRIGVNTTTPQDIVTARFTDNFGGITGLAVQNLGNTTSSYSGMLFYDHLGNLGQFQGFNNSTKEYRINNIAVNGSINFMLNSTSRFRVRPDGDVEIPGNLYKGQFIFLRAAGSGSVHSIGIGEQALNNSVGIGNIAIGSQTIGGPGSGGGRNVGVGNSALYSNAGTGNVGIGYSALSSSTGDYTIAIGDQAGSGKFGANNYNIYVGASVGQSGSTESNTIRLGDNSNYTRFFAGGIRGITTGVANAVNVVIDGQGQLGTVSSSRRFKTDIQDMAAASSNLMRLRPVTYRYKQPYADGSMPIDYGLIAEEVAEVYPDLVAYTSDGQVETVQYHKVNAMLLNEVQKQHREIGELKARLAALERLLTTDKR